MEEMQKEKIEAGTKLLNAIVPVPSFKGQARKQTPYSKKEASTKHKTSTSPVSEKVTPDKKEGTSLDKKTSVRITSGKVTAVKKVVINEPSISLKKETYKR